ncbi:MAG: flagellar export chaperone FliS [Bryobacteraceae bacterium]
MSAAQSVYMESTTLNADPLELVRILYRAAADATRRAREHMAATQIRERAREVGRAHAILCELSSALDHRRGGSLSRGLAELYDYMQRRLLEANVQQRPEPLAEVESLLVTLLAGWELIQPETATPLDSEAGSPAVRASFLAGGYQSYAGDTPSYSDGGNLGVHNLSF